MPQETTVDNKDAKDPIIMNDAPLDNLEVDTDDFYGDDKGASILAIEDKPERKAKDDAEPVGSSMNPELQAELDQARQDREAQREEAERFREQNETLQKEKIKEANDKLFFQKAFAEKALTSVNREIKSLEKQLIAAKEDGKSDDEVRLEGELATLRAEKAKVSEVYESVKDLKPAEYKQDDKPTQKRTEEGPPAAAKEWIAKNPWYADQSKVENAKKKGVADFIYQQIKKEGKLKDNEPAFYEEVTRRLKMTDEGKDKPAGQRGSSVAPVNNNSAYSTQNGKTTVKLTPADREIMKQLRINPNIKENVAEFARHKVATERRWERDEED